MVHKLIPSTQLVYPYMASITRNGHVVVHYADRSGCLAVFTCNEKQLCQHSLGDPALVSMVIIVGMIIILLLMPIRVVWRQVVLWFLPHTFGCSEVIFMSQTYVSHTLV